MLTPEQEAEWFGAESFEAMGENEDGDIICASCGANVEDDPHYATLTISCASCGNTLYEDDSYGPIDMVDYYDAEPFEAEIPQSVKYGFGFGAGMALFQVAIIGTAMILGARRQ